MPYRVETRPAGFGLHTASPCATPCISSHDGLIITRVKGCTCASSSSSSSTTRVLLRPALQLTGPRNGWALGSGLLGSFLVWWGKSPVGRVIDMVLLGKTDRSGFLAGRSRAPAWANVRNVRRCNVRPQGVSNPDSRVSICPSRLPTFFLPFLYWPSWVPSPYKRTLVFYFLFPSRAFRNFVPACFQRWSRLYDPTSPTFPAFPGHRSPVQPDVA